MSEKEDLAIWMRSAGIPVHIIARAVGASCSYATKVTAGYQPYDYDKWLAFERSITFARSANGERGRRIANGKRAIAAFRARRERL